MLTDIESFIKYFHGQRRQTRWAVDVLPAEKAYWRPWPNEPSPAEMICRAAASHLMYATVVAHDYWYTDNYEEHTDDWYHALAYFERQTEAALDLIRVLPDRTLHEKRNRPGSNPPTPAWRFLMAMLDAEIETRARFNAYLMLLNVRQPRLGGVTIEAVRESLTTNEDL